MDIRTLLDRVDIIEHNQLSIKKYLSESLYNTPEMQVHWQRIDEGFVRGYEKYLAEIALTPDQIQSIFKQASGGAAAGEAPKDPAKLAGLVDKVLPAEQAGNLEKTLPEPDAGPVDGFEQKAAAAVQNIQGADPATKQSLMQWIKQGVSRPETQQLILAAVGAGVGSLLSVAGPVISAAVPGGGPVVAALTGAVIAGAVSVASAKLQGKDWKSAFKGAIKPALIGGAAAVVGNLATSAVSAAAGALSGSSNTAEPADQKATPWPGAHAGVGQKMPDGSVVTSLDSGNPRAAITVTRPDGSSYSMDAQQFYSMTGQQGITPQPTGPVSQGASSDPMAGVTDNSYSSKRGAPSGDMAPGDYNKMSQVPANPDGSPMSLDQVNAAKAAARAGNAPQSYSVPAPAGGNKAAFDKEWMQVNAEMDAPVPSRANNNPKIRQIKEQVDKELTCRAPAVMAQIQARQQYLKQNPEQLKRIFGKGNSDFKESLYDKQATLKEWLRRDAQGVSITSVQLYPYVVEGIMDFFKGGKKGAAPAAAGGATADALNKAWTKAGSPTDSEEVAKILQDAGVDPAVVAKAYADMGLPAPAGKVEPSIDSSTATINTQDLLKQILTLSLKDQQQILAYLKK